MSGVSLQSEWQEHAQVGLCAGRNCILRCLGGGASPQLATTGRGGAGVSLPRVATAHRETESGLDMWSTIGPSHRSDNATIRHTTKSNKPLTNTLLKYPTDAHRANHTQTRPHPDVFDHSSSSPSSAGRTLYLSPPCTIVLVCNCGNILARALVDTALGAVGDVFPAVQRHGISQLQGVSMATSLPGYSTDLIADIYPSAPRAAHAATGAPCERGLSLQLADVRNALHRGVAVADLSNVTCRVGLCNFVVSL